MNGRVTNGTTNRRPPNRRDFLGAAAAAMAATRLPAFNSDATAIARELGRHPGSPTEIADDETYWSEVARAFTVDRTLVNLNNGGVSPSPTFVQDAMKRHLDYSNEAPTYTMWQILEAAARGCTEADGPRVGRGRRRNRLHAQRVGGASDLPVRLRPQIRRRSPHHDAGLRPHAHHLPGSGNAGRGS